MEFRVGNTSWLSGTYQGAVLGIPAASQTDLASRARIMSQQVDAGAYERPFVEGTVFRIR